MKHLLAMCILVISAATFAFGECSEADKKALETFDRAWGTAGDKGDRAALMNFLADDFVGLPGMVNKTQSIEGTMRAFERNKANPTMADKTTHDLYIISCTPNTATITHRNIITTKNGAGGKEETFWTRSVHFLEKRGGKWQVVSNAGHGLDDNAMLAYMEMDWGNAIKNRDMAWFEKNLAADFTEVSFMTGAVNDKQTSMMELKNDKAVFDSFSLSGMNIRIDGNTAIVTGIANVKGKDDKGMAMDMRLRFTDTFIRRDGRWQAWASQAMVMPK